MAKIPAKVKRVQRALNQMELGKYHDLTLSQCCDYIAWLSRFKVAPAEVWEPMCEQATRLLEEGGEFD